MKKRILSLALALMMCLTLLPTAAFAAEDKTATVTSFEELQAALADDSVEAIELSGETHVDPWEGGNTLRVSKPIVDEDGDGALLLGEGVCIIGPEENMDFGADIEAVLIYSGEELGRTVALFGSWEDAVDMDAELYAAHQAAGKNGMPAHYMEILADDTVVIGRNGPQEISAQNIFFSGAQNVVIESGSYVWTGRFNLFNSVTYEELGEGKPDWMYVRENMSNLTIKEGAAVEAVDLSSFTGNEDMDGTVYADGRITVEGDLFVGPSKTSCAYRPVVCAPKDADFSKVENVYYPSAEAAMEAIGASDTLVLENGSAEVKLYCIQLLTSEEADDRGRAMESGWRIQPDGAEKFSGEGLTLEDLEDGSVRITAEPGSYQLFFEDRNVCPLTVTTTAPIPATGTAYASTQNVLVDGKPVEFQCYALKDANGYDTNYIKVRDLAYVLNGTAAQFNVGWDGSVNLEKGKAYASNGSEMKTPFSGNRAYQASAAETKVDGAAVKLESIVLNDDNGGGYTYYKLRDLGAALGFTVDWSAEKGVYIETK